MKNAANFRSGRRSKSSTKYNYVRQKPSQDPIDMILESLASLAKEDDYLEYQT